MDRQNGEFGTPEAADNGSQPSGHSDCIAPPMPSLMDLDQTQIDILVKSVPGGFENLQDAYPLSPLQEGMLFHHLLNERNDTYVLLTLIELPSYAHVCALIKALQKVIDHHDVLRTAVIWEKLPRPMQVVCRRAPLPVEELVLDTARHPIEQLKERMRPEHHRFNLCRAPLMRMEIAADEGDRWYALLRIHHILCDHQSWDAVLAEAVMCLRGCEKELPAPVPYRNYVAWALAHAQTRDAKTFFRDKLGQIQEPTVPFGVIETHRDGSLLEEARQVMDLALARRVRIQARRLGIGPARLFHAAWGLVVAHTSGRDDILYGTVLLSAVRRSSAAQRIPGLFVNTLPLRLQLRGVSDAEELRHPATKHNLVQGRGLDSSRCGFSSAVCGRCGVSADQGRGN